MSDRPIYLDHQATTPVDPRVLAAMLPYFTEKFGNAASINHAYGWAAGSAVEMARQQVATVLQVTNREIIFTSGATEANNLAIKGLLQRRPRGSHIIVSAAEHRAVLEPARRMQRAGCEVTVLPVQGTGAIDPQQVAEAIRPHTVLVSAMFANNEVGAINPLRELSAICRARGVWLHCDAAQGFGKLPLSLQELPIDLVSITAHKLYGPQGVGALVVRRGERRIPLSPLLDGSGHEQHLRSGTLPLPLIVGFGAACEIADREMAEEAVRLRQLADRLWTGLQRELPGVQLNGPAIERLPGNLNVSFAGVAGEALMTSLTRIAVSSGAACTSADPEPSHVLLALGLEATLARASLRFGIGRFTTLEEIDTAIAHVVEQVRRLRGNSCSTH